MTKLVAGMGICEKGIYPASVNRVMTREYQIWGQMLRRCESGGAVQRRQPAYVGCEVHPFFLKFQDFAAWCNQQIGFDDVDVFHLDKDILIPGNKVYGPDTCCFVPRVLNGLMTYVRSNQGLCPAGVSLKPRVRCTRYVAQLKSCGVITHIGYFDTVEEASAAYKHAKETEIRRLADLWKYRIDPRVYAALIAHRV